MKRPTPWGPSERINDSDRREHLDDRMLAPDLLDVSDAEVFRYLDVPYNATPIEPKGNGALLGEEGATQKKAVTARGRASKPQA